LNGKVSLIPREHRASRATNEIHLFMTDDAEKYSKNATYFWL